jgi:hypothetical protein
MMFKSFVQPLTGTAGITFAPAVAFTATINLAFTPAACSF